MCRSLLGEISMSRISSWSWLVLPDWSWKSWCTSWGGIDLSLHLLTALLCDRRHRSTWGTSYLRSFLVGSALCVHRYALCLTNYWSRDRWSGVSPPSYTWASGSSDLVSFLLVSRKLSSLNSATYVTWSTLVIVTRLWSIISASCRDRRTLDPRDSIWIDLAGFLILYRAMNDSSAFGCSSYGMTWRCHFATGFHVVCIASLCWWCSVIIDGSTNFLLITRMQKSSDHELVRMILV